MKTTLATDGTLHFWCPGCDTPHSVATRPTTWNEGKHPVWEWNGDRECPTFSPSVGVDIGGVKRCHFVLENGVFRFDSDCWHELRGQTAPLPDWPW